MRNKHFLLILLLAVLILVSCDPPSNVYDGENTALYSVANYSFFGMQTAAFDDVFVLDTDNFGRTLCLVRTRSWLVEDKYVAILLVAQSYNESEVAYYEFENILYCFTDYFIPSEEFMFTIFTCDQITDLKERNDWNQALNTNKMTTKKICLADYKLEFVETDKINIAISDLLIDDSSVFFDPFIQYADGTSVYLIGNIVYGESFTHGINNYIVVFLAESSPENQTYIFEKVDDVYNCQEQIKRLLNKP